MYRNTGFSISQYAFWRIVAPLPVRLKPAAPLSQVKHSITELLRTLQIGFSDKLSLNAG